MKVRNRFSLWTFFLIHVVPVKNGDSIASEGKGDYMFVEGLVVDLRGNPIPHATIDTWETDGFGLYDLQVREQITFECFYVKKQHFDSMTRMRNQNLNVEDGFIQPKMVHTHSVQLCEWLILNL
jgi:Dioxygenase